jgi:hypothetical protein
MRWFIIKDPSRHGNRAYVQVAGSKNSYGPLRTARTFTTREQAENDACGNEIILEQRS